VKKIAWILALVVILAGCGIRTDDDGIIRIGERFFVQQVFDILLNTQDYLGRTIQYEGIFRIVQWRAEGDDHIVIRYTMGCCGEEPVGFFILLSDNLYPFPSDQAWVNVTGVLEIYEGSLMLRAISLVEMEERGSALVDFAW